MRRQPAAYSRHTPYAAAALRRRTHRAHRRTAAKMARYAFVGSTTPGQHVVEDSPGFGRGNCAVVRHGILPVLCQNDGSIKVCSLQEVGAAGWVAHHPSNGKIYCTGDGVVHAMEVESDGSLTVFSSADSLGGSAYLELSADGRWGLVANYGEPSRLVANYGKPKLQ